MPTVQLLLAAFLFLLGLRLSAFFSGIETGFYRVSYLRLTVDAHAGDRIAKRLVWFAHHPSYFVATTLVGNNVSNYLVTLAVGLALAVTVHSDSGWVEILSTLALAPVIFLCGELVPKNLYYRSPLTLLRKDIRWFGVFYRLFIPLTLPLVAVTKLFERLSRRENQPLELVLGRSRLVQVLSQGRLEGLLTDVQGRLVNGLMHTAGQSVRDAMTPVARVLGLPDSAPREEILDHARRFGLSHVPLHRADAAADWYAYVQVAELAVARDPVSALLHVMPEIDADETRLEALIELRRNGKLFGRVSAKQRVVGIVSERGLVEQLFHPPQAGATGTQTP
jgi:CBS domain containing-hemolysin-like protein